MKCCPSARGTKNRTESSGSAPACTKKRWSNIFAPDSLHRAPTPPRAILAGRLPDAAELGLDAVWELLASSPEFADDSKLSPTANNARRFRYCDFMAQAGWYDEASAQMNRLLADKPSDQDKARAETAIAAIGKMRCREQFEAIKRAHNAGQFQAVRSRLANFNDKAASDDTLTALRSDCSDEYQAADKALAEAGRFLDDLTAKLSPNNPRDAVLIEAATTLCRPSGGRPSASRSLSRSSGAGRTSAQTTEYGGRAG